LLLNIRTAPSNLNRDLALVTPRIVLGDLLGIQEQKRGKAVSVAVYGKLVENLIFFKYLVINY